jgi:hypothetical protein
MGVRDARAFDQEGEEMYGYTGVGNEPITYNTLVLLLRTREDLLDGHRATPRDLSHQARCD